MTKSELVRLERELCAMCDGLVRDGTVTIEKLNEEYAILVTSQPIEILAFAIRRDGDIRFDARKHYANRADGIAYVNLSYCPQLDEANNSIKICYHGKEYSKELFETRYGYGKTTCLKKPRLRRR